MVSTISFNAPQLPNLSLCHMAEETEEILKIAAIGSAILGGVSVVACIVINSATLAVPLLMGAAVLFSISAISAAILSCSEESSAESAEPITIKAQLTQVMQETLSDLKAGFYTSSDGVRHDLGPSLQKAAANTSLFLNAGPISQRPGTEPTAVVVKNEDCLYVAKQLYDHGRNPIVLDMASDGHFGGGYLAGARAQEEDLCRRSGLSIAVDCQHGLQRQNFYPLSSHSPSAGLYVPYVPVFRAGADQDYRYLNQPFEVAFGIFAAKNRPTLDYSSGKPRLSDADAHTTREKIRAFFELARQEGHDSVVFGALGCGAFCNPPDHIAEIAFDVIHSEFAHCFKSIVIAVKDDHNAHKAHNPEGNFRPFARQAQQHGDKSIETRTLT